MYHRARILWSVAMMIWVTLLIACEEPKPAHSPSTQSSDVEFEPSGEGARVSACGDGLCDSAESVNSCQIDCGYCGDSICDESEDTQRCPLDCADSTSVVEDLAVPEPLDQGIGGPMDQAIEVFDQELDGEHCGDGVCSLDETAVFCAEDCARPLDPSEPSPDPSGEVLGYVDQVSLRDGRWSVRGWACHQGWAPSVEVEVYARGDASSGVYLKRALASEPQEDAVGNACGVAEGQHRYVIPLTEEELIEHAGEPIFVHAISPVGNEHRQLNNSGQFSLPGGGAPPQSSGELPEVLSGVTWLHTDVSGWPVTTTLSVSFQGGTICLDYDKKDVWPSVAIPRSSGDGDVDVVANPWVFLEYGGQWYGATWEWLAVGSTCKNLSSVAGDHIKQFHVIPEDWRPASGERLFFMVSALARFSDISNVQERSQFVEIVWP